MKETHETWVQSLGQEDPWFLSIFESPSVSSVQFSHSIVSDSLWPHGLQHSRPPCPSPTPRVYPNSCPLSRWCRPTISSILYCPLLLLPSIFPIIRVFFKWVCSLHQVAKVLEFHLQHQSFQWISIGVFKFSKNLKGSESFRIQEKQSILSISSHHRLLLWSRAGQCWVLSMCLWLHTSSKSYRSQRTRRDLGLDVPSGQLLVSLEEMPARFSPSASYVCVTYPERRACMADWTTKVKPFQSWKQPGHLSVSAKK